MVTRRDHGLNLDTFHVYSKVTFQSKAQGVVLATLLLLGGVGVRTENVDKVEQIDWPVEPAVSGLLSELSHEWQTHVVQIGF